MMRVVGCALLLAAGLVVTPIATGTWTVDGDVQGYPIKETCMFTQADMVITGTCTNAGTNTALPVTGSVVDTTVTFKHAGMYQGEPLTLTFKGTLGATGKVDGTIDVQPLDYQGTFTATMAAPAAAAAK